jgi:hypothetical protein
LLRRNPGAGALHDAVGNLAHGFARDFGALATCKRGFRVVERFPEFGGSRDRMRSRPDAAEEN